MVDAAAAVAGAVSAAAAMIICAFMRRGARSPAGAPTRVRAGPCAPTGWAISPLWGIAPLRCARGRVAASPPRLNPAELRDRLRAQSAAAPFLVLRDEDDRQLIIDLERDHDRLTIGRGDANDVALPWDARVSRTPRWSASAATGRSSTTGSRAMAPGSTASA